MKKKKLNLTLLISLALVLAALNGLVLSFQKDSANRELDSSKLTRKEIEEIIQSAAKEAAEETVREIIAKTENIETNSTFTKSEKIEAGSAKIGQVAKDEAHSTLTDEELEKARDGFFYFVVAVTAALTIYYLVTML